MNPKIGVPFPGQPTKKLRGAPMTVPASPYWRRYLDLGIVQFEETVPLEVEPARTPVSGMPQEE